MRYTYQFVEKLKEKLDEEMLRAEETTVFSRGRSNMSHVLNLFYYKQGIKYCLDVIEGLQSGEQHES